MFTAAVFGGDRDSPPPQELVNGDDEEEKNATLIDRLKSLDLALDPPSSPPPLGVTPQAFFELTMRVKDLENQVTFLARHLKELEMTRFETFDTGADYKEDTFEESGAKVEVEAEADPEAWKYAYENSTPIDEDEEVLHNVKHKPKLLSSIAGFL